MKFVDEIDIEVCSGSGGPGAISFHREKFVPRGGPDGGAGGKGGDLIFAVSDHLNTLFPFRSNKKYAAKNGDPGAGQNRTGHDGEDLVLNVPKGTIIRDEFGEIIADLNESEARFVYLKGGRGGQGNLFYKTSVNQAPNRAQPGESGECKRVHLELKLLADVGILGFPNAGKSTLISRVSSARPKIADYPFTTLTPNLGVVHFGGEQTLVVADIPGLVPGAHKGVGLGLKFLKHIERTAFFIHLIDVSMMSARDPMEDYDSIQMELKGYDQQFADSELGPPLMDRFQLVVLNKADLLNSDELFEVTRRFESRGLRVIAISAATGYGLKELLDAMRRQQFAGN
ncbi:MAG: GTPase ObgE [Bdellovibrionales bacterium CG10_big_fil_rev_8_21_14_0_10_45_34]|nr:MAG: GTPase ObgE [Bdellovibrionales bacterium CG10_big_fil_rev_8_21_14_0_10_45_34]